MRSGYPPITSELPNLAACRGLSASTDSRREIELAIFAVFLFRLLEIYYNS